MRRLRPKWPKSALTTPSGCAGASKRHALQEETLVHADVKLEFEREDLRAIARARGYPYHPPFLCQVRLLDDLSRAYTVEVAGVCHPHDPTRERRSVR